MEKLVFDPSSWKKEAHPPPLDQFISRRTEKVCWAHCWLPHMEMRAHDKLDTELLGNCAS